MIGLCDRRSVREKKKMIEWGKKKIIIHQLKDKRIELHPSHVGFCIMSVRRQKKGFTMNLCLVITTVWLKQAFSTGTNQKWITRTRRKNGSSNIVCSLTRANQSKNKLQPKTERKKSSASTLPTNSSALQTPCAKIWRLQRHTLPKIFFFFKAASDHLAFRARHTSTPREDKLQIYFSRRWPFAPF